MTPAMPAEMGVYQHASGRSNVLDRLVTTHTDGVMSHGGV